jgi:hypothetical protein
MIAEPLWLVYMPIWAMRLPHVQMPLFSNPHQKYTPLSTKNENSQDVKNHIPKDEQRKKNITNI